MALGSEAGNGTQVVDLKNSGESRIPQGFAVPTNDLPALRSPMARQQPKLHQNNLDHEDFYPMSDVQDMDCIDKQFCSFVPGWQRKNREPRCMFGMGMWRSNTGTLEHHGELI